MQPKKKEQSREGLELPPKGDFGEASGNKNTWHVKPTCTCKCLATPMVTQL